MNCLFKNMRTMCLAMIAGTLLLTVSCKDDDEATVTGFALDQTEVGFLNHGGAIEIRVATDETWTAISENDWCMLTPANVSFVLLRLTLRICIKNVMGKLLSIRKVVKVLR